MTDTADHVDQPDDAGAQAAIESAESLDVGGRSKTRWLSLERKQKATPIITGWMVHVVVVMSFVALCGSGVVMYFNKTAPLEPKLSVSKASRRVVKGKSADSASSPAKADAKKPPEELSTREKLFGWMKKKPDAKVEKVATKQKPQVATRTRASDTVPESVRSASPSATAAEPVPELAAPPVRKKPPRQQNILDAIRKDPARIYVEKKYEVGDLSYEVRNVSELGMELYVENSPDARITYYFPAVIVDGFKAQWESTVLSPGKGTWGWVEVPNIRNKPKVSIEMSAVGGGKLKEKVKLDW